MEKSIEICVIMFVGVLEEVIEDACGLGLDHFDSQER